MFVLCIRFREVSGRYRVLRFEQLQTMASQEITSMSDFNDLVVDGAFDALMAAPEVEVTMVNTITGAAHLILRPLTGTGRVLPPPPRRRRRRKGKGKGNDKGKGSGQGR